MLNLSVNRRQVLMRMLPEENCSIHEKCDLFIYWGFFCCFFLLDQLVKQDISGI